VPVFLVPEQSWQRSQRADDPKVELKPEVPLEYDDRPKFAVTVQGGIQTLEAIRLDDFGIENAGF
jgi:hypothetical protein